MYVFDSTDIETSCRLNGNEKIGIFVDLSGDYCLLLVAAGHTACRGHGTLTGADIVHSYKLIGIITNGSTLKEACFIREFIAEVGLKYQIIFK